MSGLLIYLIIGFTVTYFVKNLDMINTGTTPNVPAVQKAVFEVLVWVVLALLWPLLAVMLFMKAYHELFK